MIPLKTEYMHKSSKNFISEEKIRQFQNAFSDHENFPKSYTVQSLKIQTQTVMRLFYRQNICIKVLRTSFQKRKEDSPKLAFSQHTASNENSEKFSCVQLFKILFKTVKRRLNRQNMCNTNTQKFISETKEDRFKVIIFS